MIKSFLQAQVKTVDREGAFEVIASSGKVDRYGDTIDPKGWYLKNYKKNPVMLWAHSAGGFGSIAIPPVARADKVWIEGEKELRIKGHFAETSFAQELKTLVEGGFLSAVSVGFLPLVEDIKGGIEIEQKMYRRINDLETKSFVEKGAVTINEKLYGKDGEHFAYQELLEVSWVSVPALPQALVSAKKMNLVLMTKALEQIDEKKTDEGLEKKEKEIDPLPEPAKSKLSDDQVELVKNYISKTEEAMSALKEIINPDKSAIPLKDVKGRKPFVKQKSKKSDMERLLIMFDKMCETLLKKLRQQNVKEN